MDVEQKQKQLEKLKLEVTEFLKNSIIRILSDYKLTSISEKTGLKMATLSNLKKGKLNPSVKTLISYRNKIESAINSTGEKKWAKKLLHKHYLR